MKQVFLNIVLDDAFEEKAGGEKVRIGMVVSFIHIVLEWGDGAEANAGNGKAQY